MDTKRKITWAFIIVFLIGSIFGNIVANPISDYIWFGMTATGEALTPFEAAFAWYYLPALVYGSLLVLALIFKKRGTVSAPHFAYGLIALAGIGVVLNITQFNFEGVVVVMMVVPLFFLYYILTHKGGKWR